MGARSISNSWPATVVSMLVGPSPLVEALRVRKHLLNRSAIHICAASEMCGAGCRWTPIQMRGLRASQSCTTCSQTPARSWPCSQSCSSARKVLLKPLSVPYPLAARDCAREVFEPYSLGPFCTRCEVVKQLGWCQATGGYKAGLAQPLLGSV